MLYGAHDAMWLGYYDYLLHECGLDCIEPLTGLIELAQCCGWWSPYADVCMLQDRHSELHRDDRGRLHNPDGMAVAYPDGWGFCAWHGVVVDERIIHGQFSASDIRDEENAEIRRVMLEIYGEDNYITEIGLSPVDTTPDDESYPFGVRGAQLYRAEMPGDEALTMVRIENCTIERDGRKTYYISVPPSIQTAHEAVAWHFHCTPETYQPIFEA